MIKEDTNIMAIKRSVNRLLHSFLETLVQRFIEDRVPKHGYWMKAESISTDVQVDCLKNLNGFSKTYELNLSANVVFRDPRCIEDESIDITTMSTGLSTAVKTGHTSSLSRWELSKRWSFEQDDNFSMDSSLTVNEMLLRGLDSALHGQSENLIKEMEAAVEEGSVATAYEPPTSHEHWQQTGLHTPQSARDNVTEDAKTEVSDKEILEGFGAW